MGTLLEKRSQAPERSRLVDLRRGHDACNRLSQCVAEQRMVIGNDEAGAGSGRHLFFAKKVAANPLPPLWGRQASFSEQLSSHGRSPAKPPYFLWAKPVNCR